MLVLSSQSCYLYKITCKGFDLMYGCSIMHEAFFKFLVLQFQKENLKKSSLHPHSFVVVLKLSFPELFFVCVFCQSIFWTEKGHSSRTGKESTPSALGRGYKKKKKKNSCEELCQNCTSKTGQFYKQQQCNKHSFWSCCQLLSSWMMYFWWEEQYSIMIFYHFVWH